MTKIDRHLLLLIAVVIAITLVFATADAFAEPCPDSVKIDSVTYPVSDYWCGKAIPKVDLPRQRDLVLLPKSLSFDNYLIAVLPSTRDAFVKMAEAAKKDSVELIADSGFRSLSYQRKIIRDRMATGKTFREVLLSVAPPGYSEHHTGRALDLAPSEITFASSKIYRWLKLNASRFGFYETMPKRPDHDGFWEPWHWSWHGDRDTSAVK